jgi:hypothetical protein
MRIMRHHPAPGFSRVDVLVALAALSLLVLLQASASGHSKGDSHRALCADNLRRLALGWQMFADDNSGRLVANRSGFTMVSDNWVMGWLDYGTRPDNTNLALLTGTDFWPYTKATEIYRCPEDIFLGAHLLDRGWTARVRSYSMNSWMGTAMELFSPGGFQMQTTLSHVRQPDATFVFIEEHPDSINDGALIVRMNHQTWTDLPAAYHFAGANLGFADGAVRYRRWRSVSTLVPIRYSAFQGTADVGSADPPWLQSVTTYRQ